ncbi:diacylglycerol kinase family protein [bacterium]|nr:diacylglycerol kinase family protein [bacterium]
MTRFKSQGINNTFKNAGKGIRICLKTENNMRVHFFIALFVIVLGLVLDLSVAKLCILLLAIGLVVVAEMLNSAIEFTLDAMFHNKYSKLVGMAKDISAGAVMFATFIAISIGLIMFGSVIYAMI